MSRARRSARIVLLCVFPALGAGCLSIRAYQARERVRVVKDVRYVTGSEDPKHLLDLYLPKDRTGFPVVVFIHGGYWTSGDRRYYAGFTGLYGTIGIALARNGIGAVMPSYRLGPRSGIDAQLDDLIAVLRWCREQIARHGGDARRMVIFGHSAGGHLTALLASDAGLVARVSDGGAIRGYIPMSAIFDLGDMAAQAKPSFNEKVTVPVFGRERDRLIRYSPVRHFRSGLPPFLILVGAEDYPYLRAQSRSSADRLRGLGVSVDLLEVAGYSHTDMVLKVGGSSDRITEPVVSFVRRVTGAK